MGKLTKTTLVALHVETGAHWTECNKALEANGFQPLTEAQAVKAGFTVAPAEITAADILGATPAPQPAPAIPAVNAAGSFDIPADRDPGIVAAIRHVFHGTAANFKTLGDAKALASYRVAKEAGDRVAAYDVMFRSLFDSLYVQTANIETEAQAKELIENAGPDKLGFTQVLHALVALLEKVSIGAHKEYKDRKAAGTHEAKRNGYLYACEWLARYAYEGVK